eukprot:CAMPEP_0118959190 /NCGR_PEP_ID=MMETSP1169-20130426/63003_1 /TAXON_ID=36882 /ORGANISM="Pyramimonas obovata, Strain CCMP722" /LENGTH=253 /DNA_ID=CAMNT_0006907319 /DNA_START=650 /DNA_END=1411 /DNA_ORIENTATION=-
MPKRATPSAPCPSPPPCPRNAVWALRHLLRPPHEEVPAPPAGGALVWPQRGLVEVAVVDGRRQQAVAVPLLEGEKHKAPHAGHRRARDAPRPRHLGVAPHQRAQREHEVGEEGAGGGQHGGEHAALRPGHQQQRVHLHGRGHQRRRQQLPRAPARHLRRPSPVIAVRSVRPIRRVRVLVGGGQVLRVGRPEEHALRRVEVLTHELRGGRLMQRHERRRQQPQPAQQHDVDPQEAILRGHALAVQPCWLAEMLQ